MAGASLVGGFREAITEVTVEWTREWLSLILRGGCAKFLQRSCLGRGTVKKVQSRKHLVLGGQKGKYG